MNTWEKSPPTIASSANLKSCIAARVVVALVLLSLGTPESWAAAGRGALVPSAGLSLDAPHPSLQFISPQMIGGPTACTGGDDTAVLSAWLTAIQGKVGYLPPGTCRWVGTSGPPCSDNITTANTTIIGSGSNSIILNINPQTGPLNSCYAPFKASNIKGLRIEGITFDAGPALRCIGCTDPKFLHDDLNGLRPDGSLNGYGVYFENSTRIQIANDYFHDQNFAVYFGATAGSETKTRSDGTVSDSHFVNDATAGSFTAQYPVGVYSYFGGNVKVIGSTFTNIYSSVDNGTTGTGMGYGVYDGDGATVSLTLVGDQFEFDGNGSKNGIAVLVSTAEKTSISGLKVIGQSGSHLYRGIQIEPHRVGMKNVSIFSNMLLDKESQATNHYGIYIAGSTADSAPVVRTDGNSVAGFENAIRIERNRSPLSIRLSRDHLTGQFLSGIRADGLNARPLMHLDISDETILGSGTHGIDFNGYVVSPIVQNCHIENGNTSKQVGDAGAAILFSSFSFGSFIRNNVIGNHEPGSGRFSYGVQNTSNASSRIFKDILVGNVFRGIPENRQFGRYWTSLPSNGTFDANNGDYFQNVQLGSGGYPGWYVVMRRVLTLTKNATNSSTTVNVVSTSSISAGDTVLFTTSSNPYLSGAYYDATKWWADTVASVRNGTTFALTNGIPRGNGPYVAGAAFLVVTRFRAAGSILTP